ncbi:hypothetical protein VA599_16705 [Chromobacterium sp. TRC.1.1.SA]|uniref:MacB-like periplasmic core domain-containing protein n=1 Tax=Chromobacterium indicum TaxID=3110228 RepID=A0ABV0CMJ1_9NEIS
MAELSTVGKKELEKLVVQHIPRDALMACEDAYFSGDLKGRLHSARFVMGHRPSAAGQNKHFFINESFYEALQAQGANPMPLRGTQLVIGRLGIFNITRLNVPDHKWVNLRRSTKRKSLAELNINIEMGYVQSDLFATPRTVAEGTIFILGVMDGIDESGISQLTQVMIALPAPDMKSWLYISKLEEFLKLYDQADPIIQPDKAVPKLKAQPKKQADDDQGY